ncbi:MAG TPA: MerR family transcriptional regulator [Acidimicrobiales bacterium]|nr:MerR family transcriptional regulator [Acidimicrobiales bacterium]
MNGFTIDELARLAGTTGRNVRAFQTQGLLPHPTLVGRTGFYRADHLDHLRAILRLQREGFSLASIAALFDALRGGLTLEQVVGLPRRTSADEGDDNDELFGFRPPAKNVQLLSAVPTNLLGLPSAS